MSLTKPGVNTEPGPDWATQLNSSLDTIDTHDHSSSKGVKITPAGMNITSDLSFQSQGATNIGYLGFSQVTAPTANDTVFVNTDGDLQWKTSNGTYTILTSTGSAAAVGGFTGDYSSTDAEANYSDLTKSYSFLQDTGISASLNSGPISIFENVPGSNSVTIDTVSSLAASYTITLPAAVAASNSLLLSDTSGNLSYVDTGLQNLTSDEVTQLGNIDSTTISTTQWGYLGTTNQGVATTDAVTFATVNTGQGANELYAMNQDVQTTDNVTFDTILHGDGTEALPGIAFSGDTDTGIYRTTADVLRISANGSQIANFSGSGINPGANATYDIGSAGGTFRRVNIADGSATIPSYTFGNDQDLGFYLRAAGQIGYTSAGTERMSFQDNGIAMRDTGARLFNSDGSVSAPSYTFLNDSNTGFYTSGSGVVRVSSNGTNTITFGTTTYFNTLIRDSTTGSAANVHVQGVTGQLFRSTSSKRYKEEINYDADFSWVYDLKPVYYKDAKSKELHLGLIAEDVAAVSMELVQCLPENMLIEGSDSEECIPDAVNYDRVAIALLAEVKKLKERIETLENT